MSIPKKWFFWFGAAWLLAPALLLGGFLLKPYLPGNEVGWSFYYPQPHLSVMVFGVLCWLVPGVLLLRLGGRA